MINPEILTNGFRAKQDELSYTLQILGYRAMVYDF